MGREAFRSSTSRKGWRSAHCGLGGHGNKGKAGGLIGRTIATRKATPMIRNRTSVKTCDGSSHVMAATPCLTRSPPITFEPRKTEVPDVEADASPADNLRQVVPMVAVLWTRCRDGRHIKKGCRREAGDGWKKLSWLTPP
ncbi:hypothetical protein GW17_00009692 [Ensete ventricosum]|nr:hypothetical protein GW17_00009692 [Ensete ventricosum]